MTFGEYIQKLREAKGFTLSKAARELGMSPQRLCDIENGRRNFKKHPPVAMLRLIATVYDHPFAQLVSNTEFFQYEKSIIFDLLEDLQPIVGRLEKSALEMLIEAKQYTPEMEAMAREAVANTQDLKAALLLAKTRHTRGPRGRVLENGLLKREGSGG